jgi:TolA-binding protein
MLYKKLIIFLILILFLSGCGTTQEEVPISLEEQLIVLTDLDQRLKQIEETTNNALDRLDKEQAFLSDRVTIIEQDLDKLESDVKTLKGKIDNQPWATQSSEKGFADSSTQTYEPSTSHPEIYSGTIVPHTAEVKSKYENARTQFETRNYQQAVQEMSQLLQTHPNTDLSDNFQYWIGESYYGMGEYQKALAAFQKVHQFPESNKVRDANIMINKCHQKLGITDY